MKRYQILSVLFLCVLSIFFLSCSKDKSNIVVATTTYTIQFQTNGGGTIADITVTEGNKITAPTAPTKADYIFDGWYTDATLTIFFDFNTAVKQSLTLYAKWRNTKHTVQFQTNGGGSIANIIIADGNKITAPTAPTKADYAFDGWCIDAPLTTLFDFNTPITQSVTLYAKWRSTKCVIQFQTNGGSTIADITITEGNKITEPSTDPTNGNKGFIGWYADATFQTPFNFANTTISKNTTLYARWTNGDCIIDANGKLTGVPDEKNVYIPRSVNGITVREVTGREEANYYNIFGYQNQDNNTVESVIFPATSTITKIGHDAFIYCRALVRLTIPWGVTTIGDKAFYFCTALSEVTLPSTVTTIEADAFAFNGKLTTLKIQALSPPTLGSHALHSNPLAIQKIQVPASAVNAYKTADGWSTYADKIEAY